MTEQTASRTLVKSPPELWAEVSDPGSLARHLGEFGEIRITRIEGESTVAWEGERASGTVEIAPSGWGTKVTLTARGAQDEPEPVAPEPEPEPEPEPIAAEPEPPLGFFARLRARWRRPAPAPAQPEPEPEPEAEPDPGEPTIDLTPTLSAALDSLGAAHHRPFSRG